MALIFSIFKELKQPSNNSFLPEVTAEILRKGIKIIIVQFTVCNLKNGFAVSARAFHPSVLEPWYSTTTANSLKSAFKTSFG